jgi:predicted dienelactone hydrolase
MTLTDILLIAATVAFVLAWWIRRTPARRIVLIAAAAAMLVIGIAGYMNFRWQNAAGSLMALIYFAGLGVTLLKNRITRTVRTSGVPFVSGSLVALGAVAVIAMIVTFPVWPLPKPSGQHAVGMRTFEITDASRPGVVVAGLTEPRRQLVRVWYPAQSVSGDPAPYFNDAEANSTATSLGALVGFPPFFTYTRHVKTNSYIDAPLLAGATNLPTAFYSHGYTSFLNQNTSLMEELASHGYVVFSVQHTYDSSDTAFPNGDVAPMDPKLLEVMANEANRPSQTDALAGDTLDKRIAATLAYQEFAVKNGDRIAIDSTRTWVADRLFLHDTLETAPPASVADIARASNLAKVGELGMSFGGAISGEICMIDTRCAAGVNMDGGNFPFTAFNANVPAPFLMFHSDISSFYKQFERPLPPDGAPRGFNEFSYERIAEAGTRPDVYRVRLKDSQHLGLSDFAWFVGQPVRGTLFGDAPADIMLGAQNAIIRGLLDKHLRNMDNGFPEKQLADYKDWVLPTPNADIPAWWTAKPEAERAAYEARINAAKPVYVLPDITLTLPPTPEQAANAPT